MKEDVYEYGIWQLVVFAILFFTIFVLGFLQPRRKREWRNLGIFEAFIVALYTEMYGFPLTLYILSGFLISKFLFFILRAIFGLLCLI